MTTGSAIHSLAEYCLRKGLIAPSEKTWAINTILDILRLDACEPGEAPEGEIDLAAVLDTLLDDAHARGVLAENSIVYRDLFDTRLMGALTPRPAQVIEKFRALYAESPEKATDWYYEFSQDTELHPPRPHRQGRAVEDRDRVRRAGHHHQPLQAGEGPRAPSPRRGTCPPRTIPRCQLCARERGLRRAGQPPRAAEPPHRAHHHQRLALVPAVLPLRLLQRALHRAQRRAHADEDRRAPASRKLLDFVRQFPHYFVGSNADLPIVGGSILAHDHFQGGRYTFAMAKAPVETPVTIRRL